MLYFTFTFIASVTVLMLFAQFLRHGNGRRARSYLIHNIHIRSPRGLVRRLGGAGGVSSFHVSGRGIFIGGFRICRIRVNKAANTNGSITVHGLLGRVHTENSGTIVCSGNYAFISQFCSRAASIVLGPFSRHSTC